MESTGESSPWTTVDEKADREQVPRTLQSWPANKPQRASLCNFGYGGTNTHVILEGATKSPKQLTNGHTNGHANGYTNGYTNGATNGYTNGVNGTHSNSSSHTASSDHHVYVLSGKDEVSSKAMITNLGTYLKSRPAGDSQQLMQNLAYTLGEKRSTFSWVAAASASSLEDLLTKVDGGELVPKHSSGVPRLGFVFTGQGAQWHAMGRELVDVYPVFKESIWEADRILTEFEAEWSLKGKLSLMYILFSATADWSRGVPPRRKVQ